MVELPFKAGGRVEKFKDTVEWLLGEDNPSVRYWTLKYILGAGDSELDNTRRTILYSHPVKTILDNQDPQGFWISPDTPYLPKYKATYHQLLILSELGVPRCPQIEKAVEYIFGCCQYESGHFSFERIKTERGRKSNLRDGACLTGNILRALLHFGYLRDGRTQKIIDFLVETHEGGWSCRAYPIDREKVIPQNCYMGGVKPLVAFSMIPEGERGTKIEEIIKEEVETYLKCEIFMYLRDEKGERKAKFGWTRFGFPLFYQSDALEVLEVLTGLEVKDERMQKAVDLVSSKEVEGKWVLENTFNGKMWADIEEKGKPSKWITLKALKVLKSYQW